MRASLFKKYISVAVRKTKKGLALKRWFKEKWTDEKGNVCGSRKNKKTKKCRPSRRVSGKTVKTWGEMSSSEKRRAVAEKKRVGMGRKTSQIRRKSTKRKKRKGNHSRTKTPPCSRNTFFAQQETLNFLSTPLI